MSYESMGIEVRLKTAMLLVKVGQILKLIFAVAIGICYFFYHEWLTEILVISVIVALIIPLGFFDGYTTTLIEYNNQLVRDSQHERANLIQENFDLICNRIDSLEKELKRS